MHTASDQHSSYSLQGSFRRRTASFLLALAANLLLLLMLFRMAPDLQPPPIVKRLITFGLAPSPQETSTGARSTARKTSGRPAATKPSPRPPATITPPPVVPQPTPPLNMLMLSRDEYAASDISRLPSHRDDRAQPVDDGASGSGNGKDSGSVYGLGAGPGGERLYEAEWYREPTHAELATYLPANGLTGWGIVACQTVERFHVDNCQEIADSPPGSGFARAVRQAAWQFLVRPPRIGGRPQVGAWVRIRIEITPARVTSVK